MDATKRDLLKDYLANQLAQGDFKARAYVYSEGNKKFPKRNIFVLLQKYISDFLKNNSSLRWVVLSGVRGVGKTTVLSQLFFDLEDKHKKLFLSVDRLKETTGASLTECSEVFEEINGTSFERLQEPIFIFLDEVHYDENWGLALKTLYDRTKKVFIFATGSSSVSLQFNPDVARRVVHETLYPMKFAEYAKIKLEKYEEKGLSNEIKEALFLSKNAKEVFLKLKKLESKIESYWLNIDKFELDKFLNYGTLPFAVSIENESLIYEQIRNVLESVLIKDIPQLKKFTQENIQKLPLLVNIISSSDSLSVNKIHQVLGISRVTLTDMLDTLEKSGLIFKVLPHGSTTTQLKPTNPSKYLFTSPAFRSSYFKAIGKINQTDIEKGKLVEDTVGFYLLRVLKTWNLVNKSFTYDASTGGAAFIIETGDNKVAIEVGFGKKDFRQVNNTSQKIKCSYGISISNGNSFLLSQDEKNISLPLKWFLLI